MAPAGRYEVRVLMKKTIAACLSALAALVTIFAFTTDRFSLSQLLRPTMEADGQCQVGAAPCAPGQTCDEASDECVPSGGETDTIHSAETLTGTIDLDADTDAYTFTGQAGQTVIIQMSRESGRLQPRIDLYSPSGDDVEVSAGGMFPYVPLLEGHQLAESGQYTIVVRARGANQSGDYSLSLLVMPGATTSAQDQDGGVITSGETKSGSIDLAADTDAYTFTGQAGQTVIIQVSRESGRLQPRIDLYSPSGGDVEASAGGMFPYVPLLEGHQLAESGQYTIVVRDRGANQSGDYSLSLLVMPGATTSAQD